MILINHELKYLLSVEFFSFKYSAEVYYSYIPHVSVVLLCDCDYSDDGLEKYITYTCSMWPSNSS